MYRIGFIYATGQLTPTGQQMVECLRQEIISLVEKKYHTASFHSYLGHSFTASYGNYLFQYDQGYSMDILLAPEKIALNNLLSPSLQSCGIGIISTTDFTMLRWGEHDLARWAAYAEEVIDQLKTLDSNRMCSKYKEPCVLQPLLQMVIANKGYNRSSKSAQLFQ